MCKFPNLGHVGFSFLKRYFIEAAEEQDVLLPFGFFLKVVWGLKNA
jgi:hypothetical protein